MTFDKTEFIKAFAIIGSIVKSKRDFNVYLEAQAEVYLGQMLLANNSLTQATKTTESLENVIQ